MDYIFQVRRPGGAGTFRVSLEERMTVLDALFKIQREIDPSLAFRCACRVGMCGTCGMYINKVPRLACSTRVQDLRAQSITVEPLPNLPVLKDLVVSLEPFFDQWKRVLPAFRPRNPDSQELAVIPAASAYTRHTAGKRDCITCGACYTACGITSINSKYLGPAAINRALLRIVDPRDSAGRERLAVINDEHAGVWRCHTQFNCTAACPKGIQLTDAIVRLKRGLLWPRKLLSQ